MVDRSQTTRRAAVALMLIAGFAAACVLVTTTDSSNGATVLAVDCGVDPSDASCRRPSFMDMINGIGHRAQTNAIRQKQVKEELLKQEKASMQKLAEARLKKKHAEEEKEAAETKTDKVKGKVDVKGLEGGAVKLGSTVYKGLDIASKKAVDGEMAKLLKTGGAAAVEKKATQIRQQILADSHRMFGFGKHAGWMPPPPLDAFNK